MFKNYCKRGGNKGTISRVQFMEDVMIIRAEEAVVLGYEMNTLSALLAFSEWNSLVLWGDSLTEGE